MTTLDPILPCPFCANMPIVWPRVAHPAPMLRPETTNQPDVRAWYVECQKDRCRARGPTVRTDQLPQQSSWAGPSQTEADAQEAAVKLWNEPMRRAEQERATTVTAIQHAVQVLKGLS